MRNPRKFCRWINQEFIYVMIFLIFVFTIITTKLVSVEADCRRQQEKMKELQERIELIEQFRKASYQRG